MMTLRDKYDKLMAENKQLSKKLIEINSKLMICQQKCISIESAFDLCQKLVQHLKADNQLLRSTQVDIYSLDELLDQSGNNSKSYFDAQSADIKDIIDDNMPPNMTADQMPAPATPSDDSIDPNSGLSKSDLIAIQYENEIKELRQNCNLLSCLPLDKVVITGEDQLKANRYLSVDSESVVSESLHESSSRVEVEFDIMSSKKAEISEPNIELKCKYCGRKFGEQFTLDNHKTLHKSSDGQKIRCAEVLCGHQFDSKHDFKEHLKSVHKCKDENQTKLDSIKPKSQLSSSQTKRVFECNECKKELSSNQSLRQHLMNVHKVIPKYKCRSSGCDQSFNNWSELRAHRQIHRIHNSSIEANHSFQTPTEASLIYTTYMTTPDSTPQPVLTTVPQKSFVCQYEGCHSSYAHKTSLKLHEKRCHSNDIICVNPSALNSAQTPVSNSTATRAEPPAADFQTKLQLLELFLAEQQILTHQSGLTDD